MASISLRGKTQRVPPELDEITPNLSSNTGDVCILARGAEARVYTNASQTQRF
jgi:hypothetical protein